MMRTDDKDDSSLSLSRDFPSSSAADLAEEEMDHGGPEDDEEVEEHVGGERSSLVEGHGERFDDEPGETDEGRREKEAQSTEGGGDEDEEGLEERAKVVDRCEESWTRKDGNVGGWGRGGAGRGGVPRGSGVGSFG